jgi:diguanylate cyclase (GGDEF)-like protein
VPERRAEAVELVRGLHEILRRAAEIVAQASTGQTILRQICGELVANGLFTSSRIGILDADGIYRGLTMRGTLGQREWRRAVARADPAEMHETVSALAWRTGATQIIDDFSTDPRFAVWHDLALRHGIRAVAALPVLRGGTRWAVLSVDAAAPAVFGNTARQLLERLAGVIGEGLDELDRRAASRAGGAAPNRPARLDGVTGLPNRLALDEHLRDRLAPPRRRAQFGIGVVDIDGFRRINEQFGRDAGDLVLRAVGMRLAAALRDADFVARHGGDTFALVVDDWSFARVDGFCDRLLAAARQPVEIAGGQALHISVTIGFTVSPLDDSPAEDLLRHAALACAAAKAETRQGDAPAWKLYQDLRPPEDDGAHVAALLASGAVVVHYQPVIDVATGRIVGAEALARLRDGQRLLYPGAFLGACTVPDRLALFQQVLAAGLQQLRLMGERQPAVTLCVNVDSEVLLLDDTLAHIETALRAHEIAPAHLLLEILETHEFVDLKRARDRLCDVRALGVRLALDDMGAGYSSVLALRDLPIDMVKLDRAFTAGLRQRPDDLAFIYAFQMLTATLGMTLVVEGVETPEVLDALRMMGGGLAQGYGIARPMSEEALHAFIRDYAPPPPAREPKTLLGAYAVHLNWLQSRRFQGPGGPVGGDRALDDPVNLDEFLASNGLSGSSVDMAYRAFLHEFRRNAGNGEGIQTAAERFRHTLTDAIAAQA